MTMKEDYARYAGRGLLLDTNIALLLVVGNYDPERVTTFKRTAGFAPEDYPTLLRVISKFKTVVTLPTILAEVNSLASQFGEPARTQVLRTFARTVKQLSEEYLPSATIAEAAEFARFGLTDTNIRIVAADRFLVLTDDRRFSGYLEANKIAVWNFNHIRVAYWQ